MIKKLFFYPGDKLARYSTARQRRALAAWALIFWLGPGLVLWLFLLNALWFVGLMSLVALWWTGWSTIGTETPVEEQENVQD